jgi:hypothetical protein
MLTTKEILPISIFQNNSVGRNNCLPLLYYKIKTDKANGRRIVRISSQDMTLSTIKYR